MQDNCWLNFCLDMLITAILLHLTMHYGSRLNCGVVTEEDFRDFEEDLSYSDSNATNSLLNCCELPRVLKYLRIEELCAVDNAATYRSSRCTYLIALNNTTIYGNGVLVNQNAVAWAQSKSIQALVNFEVGTCIDRGYIYLLACVSSCACWVRRTFVIQSNQLN
jgi:hypothetical protein